VISKEIPIYLAPFEALDENKDDNDVFGSLMNSLYSHHPYELKDLSGEELESVNVARKREFFELYRPSNYDPALNDIQLQLLPRVVKSLELSVIDKFVDLGSATGRLVIASRILTDCPSGVGVELSPSRTAAVERIPSLLASSAISMSSGAAKIIDRLSDGHTTFICGDICDHDVVPSGSIYFFGTGRVGRKSMIPRVLSAIVRANADSKIRQVRIVSAGFTLTGRFPGIEMLYGIAFKTESTPTSDEDAVCAVDENTPVPTRMGENMRKYSKFYETCYGDTMGPRVLVVSAIDLDVLDKSIGQIDDSDLEEES
jgi:hypothetical protein